METANETRIFLIFYTVVNYYVLSLTFKFHEDLCTNPRARVVNARTRDKTCARARLQLVCAHLCTDHHENLNLSYHDSD